MLKKAKQPPKPKHPPLKPHVESGSYGDYVIVMRVPAGTPYAQVQAAKKEAWNLAAKYSQSNYYF